MNSLIKPLQTGEGRIFINTGGFGVDTSFDFHNCMKIDGLDKSFGDVEPIYCPDPRQYDSFIEIDVVRGADSRWTSTLSGKLPATAYSPLETLAIQKCPFNLQVHYGRCARPDDFNTFDSAIVLIDVRLTGYNLSTLTALNPGERATIDESAAISAKNMYRLFTPELVQIAQTAINGAKVTGLTHVDIQSCGATCLARSDGNQAWAAVRQGTNTEIMYTKNGGTTWTVTSAGVPATPSANWNVHMLSAGGFLYLNRYDNSNNVYIYTIDLKELLDNNVIVRKELIVINTFNIFDMAESENYVWVVGADSGTSDGKLYKIDKITGTVTLAHSVTTGETFNSVAAFSDTDIFIGTGVGKYWVSNASGVFTEGSISDLVTLSATLEDVHMFDELHWIVSSIYGVYATNDAGTNWSLTLGFSSLGKPQMTWYDNITGYMQLDDYVYRSVDSGNSWKKILTFSALNSLTIKLSPYNPNIFMMISKFSSSVSQMHKGYV